MKCTIRAEILYETFRKALDKMSPPLADDEELPAWCDARMRTKELWAKIAEKAKEEAESHYELDVV